MSTKKIAHYHLCFKAGELLQTSARDGARLQKAFGPRQNIRGKAPPDEPSVALACPAVKQGYSAKRWC